MEGAQQEAVAATIAVLKAKEAEFRKLREKLEILLPGLGDVDIGGVQQNQLTKIGSDTFFGMRVPAAIRKCLEIMKKPMTTKEIKDALIDGGFTTSARNFYNAVHAALTRMRKRGETVQLGDKKWGLASWYPSNPQLKSKKKDTGGEDADSAESDEVAGKEVDSDDDVA